LIKSFSQLVQEKGGAVNSNQESSVMKMLNAHSQKFTSKEDTDASAALLASDPLHASDLFSKEAALNDRQLVLMRQRELNRQMKDQGSIKIQQLFQETKDLNSKLFGRPEYSAV